jgi:DNA-binding winged helix-turn-helix (wHTH) protein
MSIADENTPFTVGDWRVEPELNRIVRGEEIVKIDPRNMQVLQLLASRPGQVIAQSEIETTVWSDVIVTPNSVYQSVAQLRRALGDDKAKPRYIETISRKGYRLVAKVLVGNDQQVGAAQTLIPPAAAISNRRLLNWRALGLATFAATLAVVLVLLYLRHESTASRQIQVQTNEASDDKFTSDDKLDASLLIEGSSESKSLRAQLLVQMGNAAIMNGRRNEALAHFKQALQLQREIHGENHPQVGVVLSNLAMAHLWHDQYSEAEVAARSAVKAFESLSELDPDRIDALQQLGQVLTESGRPDEARPYLEESLSLTRAVYGESSYRTIEVQIALSIMHLAAEEFDEAERLARVAVDSHARLRGDEHRGAGYRALLAQILLDLHRVDESREQAELSLRMLDGTSRPDHPYVAAAQEKLAKSLLESGEYQRAEALIRQSMKIWQQNDGWSRRLSNAASLLGEVLLAQGRIAEAEKYLTYASRGINDAAGWMERKAYREHSKRMKSLQLAKTEQLKAKSQVAELAGI